MGVLKVEKGIHQVKRQEKRFQQLGSKNGMKKEGKQDSNHTRALQVISKSAILNKMCRT